MRRVNWNRSEQFIFGVMVLILFIAIMYFSRILGVKETCDFWHFQSPPNALGPCAVGCEAQRPLIGHWSSCTKLQPCSIIVPCSFYFLVILVRIQIQIMSWVLSKFATRNLLFVISSLRRNMENLSFSLWPCICWDKFVLF